MVKQLTVPLALCLFACVACSELPASAPETPETLTPQVNAKGEHLGQLFFSDEEETEFLQRHELSKSRKRSDDLYYPRVPLTGVADWTELPHAQPGERTISDAALARATAYAEVNNSSAFIVWRNGKIEAETYFDDNSREGLLNSFSLAKPIAALAVGRAMALGAIRSLDQPASDFIEEWREDPQRSKILVRYLLDMRPGFKRQGQGASADSIMSRSFLHPRSEEILIREYPVVHEPGERYAYNNAASALVAVLIERATGRSYDEFVGAELLQKIGAPGGLGWLNREGGVMQAGCCILLPAESFLRLAILAVQDGVWDGRRLLPAGYVTEMATGTEANPHFGLSTFVAGPYVKRRGWANPDRTGFYKVLHGEPYLAADLFLFDGNMNQVVYMIPSQNMVVLRTGRMAPRSETSEWDNSYLPNTLIRGILHDKGNSTPQPR